MMEQKKSYIENHLILPHIHRDPELDRKVLGDRIAQQLWEARHRIDSYVEDRNKRMIQQAPHPHGFGAFVHGVASAPGAIAHSVTHSATTKLQALRDTFKMHPRTGSTGWVQNTENTEVLREMGGAAKGLGITPDVILGKSLANLAGGDLSQIWTHPLGVGAEAAMMFPMLRPLRGLKAGIAAGGAIRMGLGRTGAEAAARDAYRTATMARVMGRVGKGAYRVTGEHYAGSRFGRAVEKGLDWTRTKAGGKVPLWKSMTAKQGEEVGRTQRNYIRMHETEARTLDKLMKGGSIPGMKEAGARGVSEQGEYALRIAIEQGVRPELRREVAKGVSIADRTAHHEALAQENLDLAQRMHEIVTGNDVVDEEALGKAIDTQITASQHAAYHNIHADYTRAASKYLKEVDGIPELKPVAEAKSRREKHELVRLHAALDLFVSAAEHREHNYRVLGLLGDEQIAHRVAGPARVIRGARWKENEQILQEHLDASPVRAQVHAAFAALSEDPIEVRAAQQVWDAQIVKAAHRVHGKPEEFQQILDQLDGVGMGIHPDDLPADIRALYQTMPAEAPAMPATLRVKGLTSEVYSLIKRGAEFRDWYSRAARVVVDAAERLGVTPEQMTAVMAITSQQANPTFNLRRAVEAVQEFKKSGALNKDRYFPGQAFKIEHVLSSPDTFDWSGLKTNSYFGNILADVNPAMHERIFGMNHPVTIDRHMGRMLHGSEGRLAEGKLTTKQYAEAEDIIKRTAKKLGWEPREVQAAAWIPWKAQALAEATAKKFGYETPRDAERYMASAADAYERGQNMYRGNLYQGERKTQYEAALKEWQDYATHVGEREVSGPYPNKQMYDKLRRLRQRVQALEPKVPVSVVKGVQDTLGESGGHTWTPDLRSDTGNTGYLAGIPGSELQVPKDQFTPEVVVQYRRKLAGELRGTNSRLGAWLNKDTNTVYLDASKVFDTPEEALAQAKQNGDLFIWDRAKMEEIPTGLTQEEHDAAMAATRLTQIEHEQEAIMQEFTGPFRSIDPAEQLKINREQGLRKAYESRGEKARKAGTSKALRKGGQAPLSVDFTAREFDNFLQQHPDLAQRWDALDKEAGVLRGQLASPEPEALFQDATGRPGLEFREHKGSFLHSITAEVDGESVGSIDITRDGTIDMIFVSPFYRRQGIATALYKKAKELRPDLKHADHNMLPGVGLTLKGRAWRASLGEGHDDIGKLLQEDMNPHGWDRWLSMSHDEFAQSMRYMLKDATAMGQTDRANELADIVEARVLNETGTDDLNDAAVRLDDMQSWNPDAQDLGDLWDEVTNEANRLRRAPRPGEPGRDQAEDIWREATKQGFNPNDPHTKEGGRLLGEVVRSLGAAEEKIGSVSHTEIDHIHDLLAQGHYDSARMKLGVLSVHEHSAPGLDEINKAIDALDKLVAHMSYDFRGLSEDFLASNAMDALSNQATDLKEIEAFAAEIANRINADPEGTKHLRALWKNLDQKRIEMVQSGYADFYGAAGRGRSARSVDEALPSGEATPSDLAISAGRDIRDLPVTLHRDPYIPTSEDVALEWGREVAKLPTRPHPKGLEQRSISRFFEGTRARGAYVYEGGGSDFRAAIYLSSRADLSTMLHEVIGHFGTSFLGSEADYRTLAKWAGGNFDPMRGTVNRDAAERVASGLEQYISEGVGPAGLKPQFRTLARAFGDIYDGVDIPLDRPLTPAARSAYARMFQPVKVTGGKMVGAEDIGPIGIARAPYVRGRPIPRSITPIHRAVAQFNRYVLGGGRVIGKGTADPALVKAWKGGHLTSGLFTTDVAKPLVRDVVLSTKLAAIHRVREEALTIGKSVPQAISDIAIKIDPDKTATPQEVQDMIERMREVTEHGHREIKPGELEDLNLKLLEKASAELFPGQIEGRDIRQVAAGLLDTRQPIDNILWVPREWLDASGLMPPSGKAAVIAQAIKSASGVGRAGLLAVDEINNLQKLFVLYLNPAYIPINLAGNLVMNIMHQGFLAPVNLWRSVMMHRQLDLKYRMFIDGQMGNGLTSSLAMRGAGSDLVHQTLGRWINVAVDLIPRRSAWLHEARKFDLRTSKDIKQIIDKALAGDESAMQTLDLLKRRANDAIVDYERLTPLEREVTSRLIFFYPWLKGASRYTFRFALEHPMQAAGLMMMGEYAYHNQQKMLGPTPFYESTDVPISTESVGLAIPGMRDVGLPDVVGEHTWTVNRNGEEMPMVLDARQGLTQTTPPELIRAGMAYFSGDKNAPALVENLTPAMYAGIVSLVGFDPFRHKKVPRGAKTFVKQMQDVPQIQKYHEITMSEAERRKMQENQINPRSKSEAIEYALVSGFAPAPYSRSVAAQRLESDKPTKARHRDDLIADSKKYKLGAVDDRMLAALDERDNLKHELKRGMKPHEKVAVVAAYYKKHPHLPHADDIDALIAKAHEEGKQKVIYDAMMYYLENHAWKDLSKRENKIRLAKEKAGDKEKVPH